MRRHFLSFVLMALTTPAMAQQRGALTLDAMASPGRHFGIGYQLSDHFSLRPNLGLGYADGSGLFFNLGADLRFEVLPGQRITPYATASIQYSRNPGQGRYGASGAQVLDIETQGAYYGGGAGVRGRINDRVSLFTEGRFLHSSIQNASVASSFGRFLVGDQSRFELAAGLSLILR